MESVLDSVVAESPIHGATGQVPVVTGFGDRDTGGGLFSLDGDIPRRIDRLSSTGVAVSEDGSRLARLLRVVDDGDDGELLIYDERGVELYRRVPGLRDAHDAVWHDGHLVVASTSSNSLLWLSSEGSVVRRWSPGATGDAWHLNCLLVVDGRLMACAFGQFDRHRAWNTPEAVGAGIVFDVETGTPVLTGLSFPHHPRWIDGQWIVCDSHRGRLLALDTSGCEAASVNIGRWTRGLAFDSNYLYVGLSARRDLNGAWDGAAEVALLDRTTFREIARVPLPVREVYDVVLVPQRLILGLQRGFNTNQLRVGENAQFGLLEAAGVDPDLFWSLGHPLPETECMVSLDAELPDRIARRDVPRIPFTVRNCGHALLVTAPPNPVNISWRWFEADGSTLALEGDRIPLRPSLAPGQMMQGEIALTAPERPGLYVIRVTLVQEFVRWFDDIDITNAAAKQLIVE